VVVAAGVVCAWAAARAATQDRPLVTASGALAAALLGLSVALAMSRYRLAGEYRSRTDALRAEAARTAAAYAEAARRVSADLETVQRTAREADVRRRTAAESESSLRVALKAETTRAAVLEGETARLAEVTIPLAVDRLRAGNSADTVLSRLPQPSGAAHQRLLDVLVREIGTSERMRAAGMAVCASAAGRAQALTTAMLADLREMENRHGEEVLADLLHLDHSTAQAGRLADSIAVLTGARSGRRWTRPIVMESVLRGALGRIAAYQRVRLHSVSTSAVAGHAAEGVMHALAELMDNACNFSPPSEDVHVYVQETHSGVVVTVEDAGLVMPDATLARAEKLVSGEPLDVRALSGTRLGLAVVGSLARKHGLMVSFRPSSRGGTGVVVLIPPKLLTRTPEDFPGAEAGEAALSAADVTRATHAGAPEGVGSPSDGTYGQGGPCAADGPYSQGGPSGTYGTGGAYSQGSSYVREGSYAVDGSYGAVASPTDGSYYAADGTREAWGGPAAHARPSSDGPSGPAAAGPAGRRWPPRGTATSRPTRAPPSSTRRPRRRPAPRARGLPRAPGSAPSARRRAAAARRRTRAGPKSRHTDTHRHNSAHRNGHRHERTTHGPPDGRPRGARACPAGPTPR
jgi:signal transduction histidine kinase